MKKVISALTAAAMCASMSASVITVFAEYTADNTSFYLKVVEATAGTISEDGSTITFASAAEAKNAKLVVQEFIKADAANPSVQQVGSTFTVSDKAISLGDGVSYTDPIGEEKTYTIDGKDYTTDLFVSCFAYNNMRGKFQTGCGDASWGHSKNYTWEYNGVDQLSIIWASDFGDISRDNYEQTAAFISSKSDEVPFTQFDATIGDVADGTYTIDIADSWEHGENGTQSGTFINTNGKTKLLITEHPGITIKVGDAEASSDTTDETSGATDPTPTDPTPGVTDETSGTTDETPGTSGDDKKNATEWTWYLDDVYFDPETDQDVMMSVYVTKDEGTYGYNFSLKFDGKDMADAGFQFIEASQTNVYKFQTFQPNYKKGNVGAASKNADENNKAVNSVAADGDAVLELYFVPPADAELGHKYIVTLENLSVGDANDVKHKPATIAGSITIGKPGDTPADDDTQETTENKPSESGEGSSDEQGDTETKPSDQTPSDAKYLYGDVNENGKVELVDVVKLNRFLTGIDKTLTPVATVNANCMRDKKESDADTTSGDLNGKDSVEILRFLIGLVTTLPTQA